MSDVDARDFRGAALALADFDAIAGRSLETAERKVAEAVADKVRIAARRHRRSGKMERYITVKATGKGVDARVTVHAGGAVAHLIAGGVRPHTIRPVRARALAIRAGARFAAVVRHRGVRPDPFFAEGVDAARRDVDQITGQAADAIAGELATSIRRRT